MQKGEVWTLNLDPTLGAEIRKTRPVVIISEDAIGILPLRVVVPFTEWKNRYALAPWLIRIDPDPQNGLRKTSAADAFQLRSVSTSRFVLKLGEITRDALREIIEAVQVIIGATQD
jgi:mRNA interferase MazF